MAEKLPKFGSVGNWRKFEEKSDLTIVKQSNDASCVSAVGEMLAEHYGLKINQNEILESIGIWSNSKFLAEFLNSKETRNDVEWKGGGWRDETLLGALKWLLGNYKIGAMLRQNSPIGHAVLIDGLDEKEMVIIKDPDDQTSYKMKIEDFAEVFSEFVWRTKK